MIQVVLVIPVIHVPVDPKDIQVFLVIPVIPVLVDPKVIQIILVILVFIYVPADPEVIQMVTVILVNVHLHTVTCTLNSTAVCIYFTDIAIKVFQVLYLYIRT